MGMDVMLLNTLYKCMRNIKHLVNILLLVHYKQSKVKWQIIVTIEEFLCVLGFQ